MTDHLSALTPEQNAVDTSVSGVAVVLMLLHLGAAGLAAKVRRSVHP